jgi:aryl-alcohol dehydrogenase-like predicted oxidoreductase
MDRSDPGTRRVERLEENLGAAAIGLTSDELRQIDAASSKIVIQGARYSEANARLVDR